MNYISVVARIMEQMDPELFFCNYYHFPDYAIFSRFHIAKHEDVVRFKISKILENDFVGYYETPENKRALVFDEHGGFRLKMEAFCVDRYGERILIGASAFVSYSDCARSNGCGYVEMLIKDMDSKIEEKIRFERKIAEATQENYD